MNFSAVGLVPASVITSIGVAALVVLQPSPAHAVSARCGLDKAALTRLVAADIVLIGEVHDNPTHHERQACVLRILSSSARPALVWEHLSTDQQDQLDRFLAKPDRTADELGDALGWSKSGWPDWKFFRPIAEVALAADLPMYAGDVPNAEIRSVARGGLSKLSADRVRELSLDAPLPEPLQADLLKELAASHCDLIPTSAFGNMAEAQRLRDAKLASVVLNAKRRYGKAVLIAGNGHVRSDRGVPWYLRRADASVSVFVIGQSEQTPGEKKPEDGHAAAGFPADVLLSAPQPEREDPCIAMREQFKKYKSRKKEG